jgi:hypothetical protein
METTSVQPTANKRNNCIKEKTIKKVCTALVEISDLTKTTSGTAIRKIVFEHKVQLLINSLVALAYIKKLGFNQYEINFKREIVNQKLAVKLYKHYNNINHSNVTICKTRKAAKEKSQTGSNVMQQIAANYVNHLVEQVSNKVKEEPKMFAVVREEDILNAPMYNSIVEMQENPPNVSGQYVIVYVGRSFEIKPQVILDKN